MSPIIRADIQSIEMSKSHFPLSKTKLSIVIDKTQDTILELLMNSMEIYVVQEEVSQNKEKLVSSSERKYGKGFKGKNLRALYKERRNEVESTPKQSFRRPFHYSLPKESLFYKEMMAKVKKILTQVEKVAKTEKPKQSGKERKEKLRWVGKSIKQARQTIKEATKVRKDAKNRPYCYQPGSTDPL